VVVTDWTTLLEEDADVLDTGICTLLEVATDDTVMVCSILLEDGVDVPITVVWSLDEATTDEVEVDISMLLDKDTDELDTVIWTLLEVTTDDVEGDCSTLLEEDEDVLKTVTWTLLDTAMAVVVSMLLDTDVDEADTVIWTTLVGVTTPTVETDCSEEDVSVLDADVWALLEAAINVVMSDCSTLLEEWMLLRWTVQCCLKTC
jgi:hypothetical protein